MTIRSTVDLRTTIGIVWEEEGRNVHNSHPNQLCLMITCTRKRRVRFSARRLSCSGLPDRISIMLAMCLGIDVTVASATATHQQAARTCHRRSVRLSAKGSSSLATGYRRNEDCVHRGTAGPRLRTGSPDRHPRDCIATISKGTAVMDACAESLHENFLISLDRYGATYRMLTG